MSTKEAPSASDRRFEGAVNRLCALSRAERYDPWTAIDWPEALDADQPWMSPELMSIHGTTWVDRLDAAERLRLGRWELTNFFSLNATGIRDLLLEVTERIHSHPFEVASRYLYHFIAEENDHLWFFSRFCNSYAGKIYDPPRMDLQRNDDPEVESFLSFARIQIFEEIGDYYNVRMAADDRLPRTVRDINRLHHRDESRHIAFGREIALVLFRDVALKKSHDVLNHIDLHLRRFFKWTVERLYNPAIYRDAALPAPVHAIRKSLLDDPARHAIHREITRRPMSFFTKNGIIREDR